MNPRRHRSATLLAATVLGLTMVSGCSGDGDGADARGTAEVPVIVPGEPGEPAGIVSPDDVAGPEDRWNEDDVTFVQMMVPHHGQALEMTALAPAQARDARVKALASRIRAAQRPEILLMAAWLQSRDQEVPRAGVGHGGDHEHGDSHDHGHGDGRGDHAMTGMLTDAEMDALRAARGAAFDRLFLTGMIRHHEGALTMADEVQTSGEDVRVAELAADVDVSQRVEITRMRALLATV